ncbi:uncharacterized protein LOC109140177, partial [Larimichthys crocea]|uniref:uncharacterized protein LOC109140177 n=1 Tax=Larimichthys crocea TaxID=215358 RepID=UPI000F5D788F
MSCTYTYPPRVYGYDVTVQETFWFKRTNVDLTTDSEYSGRVQNICDNNKCTLRITDLRESDSAEYKFRFITNLSSGKHTGSPGVTLSVAALQVQVKTIQQYYANAELKCHSSCSPAGRLSYVWFKNGQKVREETSSYKGWFHPRDVISCALKGHENYSSPSVCEFTPL